MENFNDSLSPRKPAQKRTKDSDENLDEEKSLDLPINELGWVIHTLCADIEKRKSSKTGVRPLDECLAKLQSVLKQIKKSRKREITTKQMFSDLSSSFVDKYTGLLAEKDANILRLEKEILTLKTDIGNRAALPTTDTTSAPSFSQALTRGRPVKSREAARSKSRIASNKIRTTVAKSSSPPNAFFLNINGQDPIAAKAALWKTVSKKTKTPKMNLLTTTSGKVLVKPHDKESADILKCIANKKPGTLLEDLPKKPRIIINNLDATILPLELAEQIATQNPCLNLTVAEAAESITPIFKRGKRDLPTVSWVCEVLPNHYQRLINNRIYVGFYSCRVSAFEEVTQCFKCLQFGHPSAKCNKSSEVCAHCSSSGHKQAECPKKNDTPRCANCDGKHLATDRTCSKRAITLANLQRRTDYGTIPEPIAPEPNTECVDMDIDTAITRAPESTNPEF